MKFTTVSVLNAALCIQPSINTKTQLKSEFNEKWKQEFWDKLEGHTSYPGIDLTASTTAMDTRCWIKGILWPRLECRGMEICRVDRAQPTGLSQTFPPRPGQGEDKR